MTGKKIEEKEKTETSEKTERMGEEQGKHFASGKKLILLLAGICIILTGSIGGGFTYFFSGQWENGAGKEAERKEQEKEYILYIGLNDKDAYTQIIPTEEAQEIINAICIRYAGGYTMTKAEGAWVDEKGKLTSEQTLVYTIRAGERDIIRIMDDILPALNQNSILLEEKTSDSVYYSKKPEEREGFYDEDGK